MKTRKHKLLDAFLLLLFLVALGGLGYGIYYYFFTSPEGAVEAAALDDSELVLYVHFQDMENSEFARNVGDDDSMRQTVPPELNRFREALGIRREDVIEGLLSIRDLEALPQNNPQRAGLAGALKLRTSLSLDRLENALNEVLDEDQRGALRRSEIGDRPVLEFPVPDTELTVSAALFEHGEDGSTLYFGDYDSLRATLEKLDSRRETQLPEAIQESKDHLAEGSQAWLVAALSPRIQSRLREGLEESPVPLGPAAAALASLRTASMGIRADSSLALQLVVELGNENDARTLQEALNEEILPMLHMTAGGQMEDPPAFLEDLRADADATRLLLSLSVSADEVKRIRETAEEAMAEPEDPERTEPAEPGEPVPAEPDEENGWPRLHIERVLLATGEAIINGELIAEGDEIEGVTLYEVEERGVILRLDREYRFVNVGDTVEGND